MFIGGDHPRHLYYANKIHEGFGLEAAIIQDRGGMIPKPPDGLMGRDLKNWDRHFRDRFMAEMHYFGNQAWPDVPTLPVNGKSLNSEASARWVQEWMPDVVLIFGCGMVRHPLMPELPKPSVNLHLGLSPRYRGAATLFWPFYFLEPQMAGCTFHQIVDEPDAGVIFHQSIPDLQLEDGIHDVGAKAVIQATLDGVELIKQYPDWTHHHQKNTGKCFLAKDFKPQHLRLIYDEYDNKIVQAYLKGRVPQVPKPYLVRSF
jgi:hypothetical protein